MAATATKHDMPLSRPTDASFSAIGINFDLQKTIKEKFFGTDP
jgi:hypothetical protein